jgi:uncharacterized protein involved in outer membrane biogenesis
MLFPKPIRLILYGAAGFIGLLLILLATLALVRIPLNLEGKKALVEEIATNAVNRQVSIDGKIQVTTSLWPVFTLGGVRIANPEQFPPGDFARVESARIHIGVVPLLLGKLHVRDLSIDGLHLVLKKDKDGAGNWLFSQPSDKTASSNSLVINKISMNRLSVSYLDLPPFPVKEAEATLTIQKGKSELTDLKIVLDNTELFGKINVDETGKRPRVDIDLKSPLFQINDFNFAGSRSEQEMGQTPENSAAAEIDNDQISEEESQAASDEPKETEKNKPFINLEIFEAFDAKLNISAEKVLSGKDLLGSGHLNMMLEDGRLSINPLQLNIPGGSLLFNLSLKPDDETSEIFLNAKIENFDFGVLARRYDPQTDIGGILNVDFDLKSPAKNLADFLANETGYIDFSVYPENWRSGAIDFWIVNLIAEIAANADKDLSRIECLIGKWSLQDGVLKPDIFVVDTSHIRICGKGTVDFNTNELDLKVTTAPKKPEYLRISAPLGVHGTFSDIKLGLASMGLTETGMKFLISPLSSSLQIMLKDSIPEDGSDVCGMVLGPENRSTFHPVGCR